MVLVDGKFIYLSKTEILNRINEIRKEACETGVRDPRNESRNLTMSDYVPIKWSSDLEWIAQTRAAEATFHMAHDRPNGGEWSDVSHNGVYPDSEDIAWNYSADILGGINQWYGEKADWDNKTPNKVTGHYTSIINPMYQYVGIGAFKPASGYGAVAGELKISGTLDESQNGVQGSYKQKVEVQKSKLTVNPSESCSVHIGKTAAVSLNAKTSYENGLGSSWSPKEQAVLLQGVTYKSSDTGIVSVSSDGTVTGKEPGTASISISYSGITYNTSVTVEDHDYKVESRTEPTCTKDGSETSACSVCGDKLTEVIPSKGHQWKKDYTVDKEATCIAEGSESIHCSLCNAVKEGSSRSIAKTAHSYGEWETVKAATCTTAGSKERKCSTCGNKEAQTIKATGHTWDADYTVDKKATCTAEGSKSIHCINCNEVKDVTAISALGHKYGEWETITKATCTVAGSKERTCSTCGNKETQTIKATGHTWDADYTTDKEATCTAEGSKSIHCAKCDEVKDTTAIPALGHDWSDPDWTWSDDHSSASAKFTCKNDGTHVETVNATVTSDVDESEGNTVYTAKATFNGKEYKDTVTEENQQQNDERLYGKARYDTAIKAADEYKASPNGKFENVIVAYGQNFPDALAGGYLAKVKNAPILLVEPSEEGRIADYISKNIASGGTVYILGGTGVVSSAFEKKVKDKGIKAERLGGQSRFDTNLAILDEAGVRDEDILVCTGYGYADSLSASAVGKPILLVDNTLSDAQKKYIKGLSTKQFYLIGGEGVVSKKIQSDLKKLNSGYRVERLWGQSRYETSTAVAKKFFPKAKTVVLAYAQNFPDGLSGGPLAMKKSAPIVLTDSNKFDAAKKYVKESGATKNITLGGPALISDAAVEAIMGR